MEDSRHQNVSSRSVSPEASQLPSSNQNSAPVPEMAPVADFFKTVSPEGFPVPTAKAQPWRAHWAGPQEPSKDGTLLVACPKICTYGICLLSTPKTLRLVSDYT
ncbi:hypothetical protein B0O99DRAFT_604264 [Bisporella sp. PMI_857]|nr:hypothetical protein B0O99DRAFT_604264 [Bisporella sp. PMI_857]